MAQSTGPAKTPTRVASAPRLVSESSLQENEQVPTRKTAAPLPRISSIPSTSLCVFFFARCTSTNPYLPHPSLQLRTELREAKKKLLEIKVWQARIDNLEEEIAVHRRKHAVLEEENRVLRDKVELLTKQVELGLGREGGMEGGWKEEGLSVKSTREVEVEVTGVGGQ